MEDADLLYFCAPDIGTADSDLCGRGLRFRQEPHVIHRHPDGSEEWMASFDDNEHRPLAPHSVR